MTPDPTPPVPPPAFGPFGLCYWYDALLDEPCTQPAHYRCDVALHSGVAARAYYCDNHSSAHSATCRDGVVTAL